MTQATDSIDGWVWHFGAAVLRRRYLVIGTALLLAFLTGTFSLLRPRQYIASASFLSQEPSMPQSNVGQIAAQLGLTTPRGATFSPQFYADLLESRDLLRDVLGTRYDVAGFDGTLFDYYRIRNPNADYGLARALEKIRAAIDVRTNRVTGVVRFEYYTRVPELSVAVSQRMLRLLNEYNLRRRQSQARAEREFTEARLAEVKRDLSAAENELSDFYRANRRWQGAPDLVAREGQLQRQVALRAELFTSLAQSYEAAKIDEVRSTPVITVVERPDGFVEPKRRGTVSKTFAALFGGVIAGVVLAIVLEYINRSKQGRLGGYQEFESLWQEALGDLRRPFRRRRQAA